MQKINFLVYKKDSKIVTGGHKYDQNLLEIIKGIDGVKAEESEIGYHGKANPLTKALKEFRNGVKKGEGDILVFNSSKCLRFLSVLLYQRFIRRKTVYSIHHHFIYHEFKGIKKLIYKNAESLFLKLSSKIIIPSPYIHSLLLRKRKPEDLLYWRIPFETKAMLASNPVKGQLAYAGTIEKRKGLIYLLKALKLLQDRKVDYKLYIMGKVIDENYFKELKDYIDQNNLNVVFTGFLSAEEKDHILATSDIFVFPSLLEGFGMVLVEAQVYGLPIVCFDNSSMSFSVKDNENGFLVKTGDYKEMADKIEKIINDRSLRNRLSQGALENLKSQWSNEKYKSTVVDYFMTLAQNKN